MQKVSFLACFLIFACFASFYSCSGDTNYATSDPQEPASPEQEPEPELTDYSIEKAEFDNRLQDLGSLREEIRQATEEWERLASTPSEKPQFSDQRSIKAAAIVEKCDELEVEAKKLLETPYPRQHAGLDLQVEDLINFAEETRNKMQQEP